MRSSTRRTLSSLSHGPRLLNTRAVSSAASPSSSGSRRNSEDSKLRAIETKDRKQFGEIASKIFVAAAHGESLNWKHSPDRGIRESKKMKDLVLNRPKLSGRNAIKAKTKSFSPAERDYNSFSDIPEYASLESLADIRAGHLVQTHRNERSYIGVVLGFEQNQRDLNVVVLSVEGLTKATRLTDVAFSYPSFVSLELATKAGLSDKPESAVETQSRISIVKRLRSLETAVQHVKVTVMQRGPALYDEFRSKESDKWGKMVLEDALRFAFGPKIILQLHHALAMKHYLLNKSTHFVIDAVEMLQSRTYFVRPEEQVKNLEIVAKWVREDHPCIESFVKMARPIIMKSRSIAQESVPLDPEPISLDPEVRFSPTDLEIIQFVKNSFLRQRFIQSDPYAPHLPSIVKRLGLYSDVVLPELTFKILQELGVIARWETLIAYGSDGTETGHRGLPLGPPNTSQDEIAANARAEQLIEATLPVHGKQDHVAFDDGVDALRHDFGQLPIYAIDDAHAEEIDDGLSVETIPGSTSLWLHTHIADPTSVIHPRDTLARSAEHIGATTYFVERSWPMLPSSLTHKMFSLGSAASAGFAQPVLTFSAKISERGEIEDYKVRPGLARNVRSATYDDVDRFLGDLPLTRTFPFTTSPPAQPAARLVPEPWRDDLQNLKEIWRRLLKRRVGDNKTIISWANTTPAVSVLNPLPVLPLDRRRPRLYRGFPEAFYEVQKIGPRTASRRIIAECMITAGVVASRYARERNIPFLYRVAPRHTGTEDDCAALVAIRDPITYETSMYEAFRRHVIFGTSAYSTQRSQHGTLGIVGDEAYARVTSPLRRFVDLIGHWQIKAAMRASLPASHVGLRVPKLPSAGGSFAPLFNKHVLDKVALEHTQVERMNKRANVSNHSTWAMMLLQRYLQDPNDHLAHTVLNSLEAVILSEPVWDASNRRFNMDVFVEQLGLRGILQDVKANEVRPIGATHTVRVSSVVLSMTPLLRLALA